MYGPQGPAVKAEFLQEPADVRYLHASPWAIVGNFNLLVDPVDKSNGLINGRLLAQFRARMNVPPHGSGLRGLGSLPHVARPQRGFQTGQALLL